MERPLTVGQLARELVSRQKPFAITSRWACCRCHAGVRPGYLHYSRHDVHRLLFIRRARALGLSLATLKTLTAELDRGECLTMRPRLHALVTEQLHTVRQQIAEFHLLERQLAQVLHRLQRMRPRRTPTGVDAWMVTPQEREPRQPPGSISWKGKTMQTSTLEPLTILSPKMFQIC